MHGLSSHSKEKIAKVVDDLFDKIALRLVGSIPKLQRKKPLLIGFEEPTTLAHLFIQALGNKWLNHLEQDMLKGILEGAYSYTDILKNKTSNSIIQRIEGLTRESQVGNEKLAESEINRIINEELEKAKDGLETIALSEGTKTRNLGTVMDISKAAAIDGEDDPIIGFAGINDDKTCEECKRLFLMPDGITPRLWRVSECSMGYFKRGDAVPSILGLHPRCRHIPFNVPSDWGFDKEGHITFIGIGHDEIKKQREED